MLVYDGLYMLSYDEDAYFLVRELDTSCKPKHVYLAKIEQVEVILTHGPPLNAGCVPASTTPSQP